MLSRLGNNLLQGSPSRPLFHASQSLFSTKVEPEEFARPDPLKDAIMEQLSAAKEAKTYKDEVVIESPQGSQVAVHGATLHKDCINLCSNNYLGLSNHPDICEAAIQAIRTHGFGLSSVRFICGTTDLHKALEDVISRFHGTEDTILYPSGFDSNTAFFESILTADDAVISDELNHASIIDGIRLCKASRYRFKHMCMEDLERQLVEANKQGARIKIIATDGVFSMDGDVAPLQDIVRLAKKYNAYTFVDDWWVGLLFLVCVALGTSIELQPPPFSPFGLWSTYMGPISPKLFIKICVGVSIQ